MDQMVCTCATKTLITPYPHLLVQDYWMVEYQGHWMLQDNLNTVLKQHILSCQVLAAGLPKLINRMLPEMS